VPIVKESDSSFKSIKAGIFFLKKFSELRLEIARKFLEFFCFNHTQKKYLFTSSDNQVNGMKFSPYHLRQSKMILFYE